MCGKKENECCMLTPRYTEKEDTKILHIRVLISNDNGKVNTKYVNIHTELSPTE